MMLSTEDLAEGPSSNGPAPAAAALGRVDAAQGGPRPSQRSESRAYPTDVPWGIGGPLAAFGLWLALTTLATTIVLAAVRVGLLPHWEFAASAVGRSFTGDIIELLLLGTTVVLVRVNYHRGWQALGFRRFPLRYLALALGVLVTHFTSLTIYGGIVSALHVGVLQFKTTIPDELAIHSLGPLLLTFLAIGVAAPLAEETFFRGFLFPGLIRVFRPLERLTGGRLSAVALAALGSGALFAAAHLQVGLLIPFTISGALLAWLYRRTGSLWPGILVHASIFLVAMISALAQR